MHRITIEVERIAERFVAVARCHDRDTAKELWIRAWPELRATTEEAMADVHSMMETLAKIGLTPNTSGDA